MKRYKVEEAADLEMLNKIVEKEAGSWRPIFITPVNKIDTTGMKFDVNRRPKRFFFYLVTLEGLKK